jgi:hypothetical protein
MDQFSQTGVTAEAAVQPDINVSQPGVSEPQETLVPVSALQAERRERQQLQENLKVMQDHLALLQSSQTKQKPKDEFSSLSDSDVLTVGEAKKFIENFSREHKMAVEELKMSQQHKDYDEVVRKYIPNLLKEDPDLKDIIMNAPNPYKAAYYIAKRSDSYLQDQRVAQRSPEAQKVVQNTQRAGNLSQIGSTSSASSGGNYKQMSDADFMKLVNKNVGYV